MSRAAVQVDEEEETGWETASTTSITLPDPSVPPDPVRRSDKKPKLEGKHRGQSVINPLEQYWIERAKFIKHLGKRFRKFQDKSRADFENAKNPNKRVNQPAVSPPKLKDKAILQKPTPQTTPPQKTVGHKTVPVQTARPKASPQETADNPPKETFTSPVDAMAMRQSMKRGSNAVVRHSSRLQHCHRDW